MDTSFIVMLTVYENLLEEIHCQKGLIEQHIVTLQTLARTVPPFLGPENLASKIVQFFSNIARTGNVLFSSLKSNIYI